MKYRQRTMTAAVPDRGWQDADIDALSPFERERVLSDRDHYVEVRRGADWFPASVWAMPPAELAQRAEVKRLTSLAEGIRGKAERSIAGPEAALEGARAAVDAAKRKVVAAESALKVAKAAAAEAEAEAGAIDKQVVAAERDLDRLLRRAGSEAVAAV